MKPKAEVQGKTYTYIFTHRLVVGGYEYQVYEADKAPGVGSPIHTFREARFFSRLDVTEGDDCLYVSDPDTGEVLSEFQRGEQPDPFEPKEYTMDTDEMVTNEHGVQLDWESAIVLMDDELREELHNQAGLETAQAFFNAYASAHQARFGEVWELAKPNPVW